MDPAGGGVGDLGEFVVVVDFGPEGGGGVAGDDAGPVIDGVVGGLWKGGAAGEGAVVEVLDAAVAVGVGDVEGGDLEAAELCFVGGEGAGHGHFPVLLDHEGAIEAGGADGEGEVRGFPDDGAVDALADGEVFGGEGAVGLFDFKGDGALGEGAGGAVEEVVGGGGGGVEGEAVEVGGVDVVDGLGEAHPVAEDKAQHGESDLAGAVEVEVEGRDGEVDLVVGVPVAEGEVRVHEEHGVARGGAGGGEGPGVGLGGGRGGRCCDGGGVGDGVEGAGVVDLEGAGLVGGGFDAGGGAEVGEVDDAVDVEEGIDGLDGEDGEAGGVELVAVGGGGGVHAGGEG